MKIPALPGLIPLRGQEPCQKQAVIPDEGRSAKMKKPLSVLAAALCLSLGGCDGFGRVIYFKEPGMVSPRWHAGRTIIEVREGTDAQALIDSVAKQFELKPTEENTWIGDTGPRSTFSLRLHHENQMWYVSLLDWPDITRSDLSRQIETAIRNQIEM